jgi:UDP-N-acetylglucosamine:LPS N-acetylglucosamine transferase
MEAAALGKVCIFFPLPWSAGNEQLANAQWLVKMGSSMIIDQNKAIPNLIS